MKKVFQVPIPTHLVKFVSKELWDEREPPFFVSERSILGKHIFSILVDQREFISAVDDDTNSILEIKLSNELAKRSPDVRKLKRISRFLDEMFKKSLMLWVKAQMQMGSNRYQAVISFLSYYDSCSDEFRDRYYLYVKRYSNMPYKLRRDEKEKNTAS